MKLHFNLTDHGIFAACPIEYNVFRHKNQSKNGWCAGVASHINSENGYLNQDGNIACSWEKGQAIIPDECLVPTKAEAETICQKHFDSFMEGLEDLAMP